MMLDVILTFWSFCKPADLRHGTGWLLRGSTGIHQLCIGNQSLLRQRMVRICSEDDSALCIHKQCHHFIGNAWFACALPVLLPACFILRVAVAVAKLVGMRKVMPLWLLLTQSGESSLQVSLKAVKASVKRLKHASFRFQVMARVLIM